VKFKFFVDFCDGWIGYYYDKKKKILYIGFPFWCMWSFAQDQNEWDKKQRRWVYDMQTV